MFPVLVSVHNAETLKKVYELLGDGPTAEATATTPATPAKVTKPKAAPAAAAAPATPTPTAPVAPVLSPAAQKFLQEHLADPVTRLSMKDEPKMREIVTAYGVEKVSLIPEKFFPDVLAKVQEALDPGYAERKRLEAIDAAGEAKPAARSLL